MRNHGIITGNVPSGRTGFVTLFTQYSYFTFVLGMPVCHMLLMIFLWVVPLRVRTQRNLYVRACPPILCSAMALISSAPWALCRVTLPWPSVLLMRALLFADPLCVYTESLKVSLSTLSFFWRLFCPVHVGHRVVVAEVFNAWSAPDVFIVALLAVRYLIIYTRTARATSLE